jgi:hypothetical protein
MRRDSAQQWRRLPEPRFGDQRFQFGLSYEYQVRAISQPP